MAPRIGSTPPARVAAPVVSSAPAEEIAAPEPKKKTDQEVAAILFDQPVKKLVNTTGRYAAVAKAPVPPKPELDIDVNKLRAAANAGVNVSGKPTGDVKKALDQLAKGKDLYNVFKDLTADQAKEVYARMPAAQRKAVEAATPSGDMPTAVRMAQVQNMSNDQLKATAKAMSDGKVKDTALELAVATELAARTEFGAQHPEVIDTMRYLVLNQKLGYEDLSSSLHKDPAGLAGAMIEHASKEYAETQARVDGAVASAPNPRGQAKIVMVDGSMSNKSAWADLPSDLKSKMPEKVWAGIKDPKQRDTLLQTYSRLKGWGVWDQVKTVERTLEPREKHTRIAGKEFEVNGNSGGIVYTAHDAKRFEQALKDTGHFGVDNGALGAMHKGQVSMREWTEDKGSLHLAIGPGNQFDAHVDTDSPVVKPENGKTQITAQKGFDHHRKELWPEYIRKYLGIPGLIIDAGMNKNPKGGLPEGHVTGTIEVRGPVKSERKKVDTEALERIYGKGIEQNPVLPEVVGDALKNVDLSKAKFPDKGVPKSDRPDPERVAEILAQRMLEAAQNGKGGIEIDFPVYKDRPGHQAPMEGEMRRLGEQVRRKLQEAIAKLPPDERAKYDLDSVTKLRVKFGANNGATVSLTRN
ncbi:MAG: hypothetical protein QM817_23050 [Archangium sp.]